MSPVSHLRFVLATGASKVNVTRGHLALEGTKKIRPSSIGHFRSIAAYFAFGGQGGR